jgi:hypothetical protein
MWRGDPRKPVQILNFKRQTMASKYLKTGDKTLPGATVCKEKADI